MVGYKSGFTTQLSERLGRNIYSHHCLAHRIELIHKNVAIKGRKRGNDDFPPFNAQCLNCRNANSDINRMASQYKSSHKLSNHKTHFCQQNGYKKFYLHQTFDVRWSASTFRAYKATITSWEAHIEHMQDVSRNPLFSSASKKQCTNVVALLGDKNFLATVNLEMDILLIFKGLSERFQVC